MSVGTDFFACVFAFGCSKAMLIDGGGAGGRSIYLDDRMLRSITKSREDFFWGTLDTRNHHNMPQKDRYS